MRDADNLGTAAANPFMDAGMDQFVMDDEIVGLWQRREDGEIGDIAATEIQRGFGAEVGRCLGNGTPGNAQVRCDFRQGNKDEGSIEQVFVGSSVTLIVFEKSYGDLHSYVRSLKKLPEEEAVRL